VRGVITRSAVALLLPLGLLGCDLGAKAEGKAPPELTAALAARTVYPAKREEWRTDITSYTDSTMVPRVFRASGTTVALLQDAPQRISLFELNRKGMLLSTRPARVDAVLNAEVPRDIVAPTDLSRVTDDGQVDIIDSASSVLVRESIGGYVFRRDLPLLRGGSGRLCTVSPATLLHVRTLGARRSLEAFTLTADPKEDSLIGRHRIVGAEGARLRFGSGDSRRCLLITGREVLIVSAPDDPGAGAPPRLSRLKAPGDTVSHTKREVGAAARTDSTLVQPYVVDAAIVDGGFVLLLGVESDRFGRLLDYYNEKGEYIQSAMLPFTASAMAASGPRFLVLHQDERFRWWLSSWLTPMAARGATAPPEPRQVNRAPERQLFEPPSRQRKP
jgi:hypothetical protein